MDDVQIAIEQGTLRGIIGTDLNGKKYYSFYGIPYAKPPIGKLRFKAPQPPEKWTGIRNATVDTGACYSRDVLQPTVIAGSEDCLVLNVYTPQLRKDKSTLKPVMVWIHGGAFIWGSNDSKNYGPQFLITEDVVIVAINYRLGILGFLSIDDPEVGVPGNAGLKDMVMALKWVQGNIKDFGGDANNVTIFGESAGSGAVHLLVLSPMAKGLFHRAIAQSGCALNPWAIARPSAKDLAKVLNCPATKDADILSFLQSLPVEEVFSGQDGLKDRLEVQHVRTVGPVIEKVTPKEPAFLSEQPIDIILKGNYNKVPLIMGYTEVEGLLFDVFDKLDGKTAIVNLEELILPSLKLERGSDLSKAVASKLKKFYYDNKEPSEKTKLSQYLLQSDTYFVCGIHQSIKYHSLSSNQPIYLYRFTIQGRLNFLRVVGNLQFPGAAHADDIGYLFKTFATPEDLEPDSIELKTVRRMVKFWANFARPGNPNSVENVKWEAITRDKLNYLDIGEKLVASVNPDRERMEFWDNILK